MQPKVDSWKESFVDFVYDYLFADSNPSLLATLTRSVLVRNLGGRYYHCAFLDGESAVQRGEVACPGYTAGNWQRQGSNSDSLAAESLPVITASWQDLYVGSHGERVSVVKRCSV